MSAYDYPMYTTHSFPVVDFAAGGGPYYKMIRGPKGFQGRLIDFGINTTEATVWTTTEATFEVGIAADHDEFGKMSIPTGTSSNVVFNTADDLDAIIDESIPPDTDILLTFTEGTGGSITGQGIPYVLIAWF